MGSKTGISWTTSTWNLIIGCSHVSPGCEFCYAEKLALRWGWTPKPWKAQFASENVILKPERLDQPLRWREPRMIFVNSMSDLFHEQVPDAYVAAVFGVMAATPHHTYQILTKRPERMLRWFSRVEEWADVARENFAEDTKDWRRWQCLVGAAIRETGSGKLSGACSGLTPWPLPNVWLGVSVEDQRRADERIPLLLQTPAAIRFLSCEPLLGPVNLGLPGTVPKAWGYGYAPVANLLHWVIVGGESAGPVERRLVEQTGRTHGNLGGEVWTPKPEALEWTRSLRDQCQDAGVSFFFKQWGGPRPTSGGDLLDGVQWHEFPSGVGDVG